MKRFLVLIFLMASAAHGEGWLSVQPTNDFQNGRGASLSLDVDQKLWNPKWTLEPHLSFANVQYERDYSGVLNLMYAYSPKIQIGVGTARYSYEEYGSDKYESSDVHTVVKVKLW